MRWERDVSLADRVRWRIGGPARRLGTAGSDEDLADALRGLAPAEHLTLGWGANLLVADRGVEPAVLTLDDGLDWVRIGEGWIEAGAGAGLPSLIGEARRAARSGWSFLEAVPGSVGGGLRMNAGSAETGIWDRVLWADARTADGERVRVGPDEAGASYRRIALPESWVFVAARFEAPPGDPAGIEAEHRERRTVKVETQVYDLPTCGSVWKNPGSPWGSAWELVERVGMRGARVGGAVITEKHANFIANVAEATAEDVLALMRETRRRVMEETGARLEPEIRFWGFEADELRSVGVTS